jgi:hypothetical protein
MGSEAVAERKGSTAGKPRKPRKPKALDINSAPKFNARERAIIDTLSVVAGRASVAARMGKSFGDDRDLYVALGYKKLPTYNDFRAKLSKRRS